MSTEIIERLERIEKVLAQANNPYVPHHQAQAGLQLATVEVPWLVEHIRASLMSAEEVSNVVYLEEYRGSRQQPPQALVG